MILALAVEIGSTFSSSSITIQLGQVASESINLEEKQTSHVYSQKRNCEAMEMLSIICYIPSTVANF